MCSHVPRMSRLRKQHRLCAVPTFRCRCIHHTPTRTHPTRITAHCTATNLDTAAAPLSPALNFTLPHLAIASHYTRSTLRLVDRSPVCCIARFPTPHLSLLAAPLPRLPSAMVDSVQVFGRKKTSVAVAYCKRGRGLIKVNGQPIEFVQPELLRLKVLEPLLVLGANRFQMVDIRVRVQGGGYTSQIYGPHIHHTLTHRQVQVESSGC